MAKRNFGPFSGYATCLTLMVIVSMTGYLYLFKQININGSALSENAATIAQMDSLFSFDDEEDFENNVAASISKMLEKKKQKRLAKKFDEFKNAKSGEALKDKRIYGNINARFTLVEFSDLECGYCKRFHETPKTIVDISKGQVNWQWINLPLSFHNPAALKEAHAAECVAEQSGNQGFWVFINDIFIHTKGNGSGVSNLAELASESGAHDVDKFNDCMASNRYAHRVKSDMDKAKSLSVNSTPATYIVDNLTGTSQLVKGAQPIEAILGILKVMMKSEQKENMIK